MTLPSAGTGFPSRSSVTLPDRLHQPGDEGGSGTAPEAEAGGPSSVMRASASSILRPLVLHDERRSEHVVGKMNRSQLLVERVLRLENHVRAKGDVDAEGRAGHVADVREGVSAAVARRAKIHPH